MKSIFSPHSFAVVGAGPVGSIVAAFLARAGYRVTLCDVFTALTEPARHPGIIIEGAEHLQQKYRTPVPMSMNFPRIHRRSLS